MTASPPAILCIDPPPAFHERLQTLFSAGELAAVHAASHDTALATALQTQARCCLVAASALGEYRLTLVADLQLLCPVLLLTDPDGPPPWLPSAYAAGLAEHLAADASVPELRARLGRYLTGPGATGPDGNTAAGPSAAAVASLAGGVAHDMNNILAVLMGAAGLLRGAGRQLPEVERVADILDTGSERGAEVVSQLLAFANSLKSPPQSLDLGTATPGLLAKQPANIRLQSTATGRALANLAPAQLAGIVNGLLATTANQFPDGAEVALATSDTSDGPSDTPEPGLEVAEDAEPWVTLRIQAHPKPTTQRNRLSDVATKPRVRPTAGLGYAIAQTTVEQLGGRLRARAEADGSLFYEVQLPSAAASPMPSAPQAEVQGRLITPPDVGATKGPPPTMLATPSRETLPATTVEASPPATARSQGVLIVAPDAITQRLLVDALEVLGFGVVAACAPRDALQTLRTERESVAQLLLVVDPAAPPAPNWLGALRSARPGLRLVVAMAAIDTTIEDCALRLGAAAKLRLPLDLTACEAALRA